MARLFRKKIYRLRTVRGNKHEQNVDKLAILSYTIYIDVILFRFIASNSTHSNSNKQCIILGSLQTTKLNICGKHDGGGYKPKWNKKFLDHIIY